MSAETIRVQRVAIRPLDDGDWTALETWYDEAAKMAFEGRSLERLRGQAGDKTRRLLALNLPNEEEPIGLLEYEARKEALMVPFIALAKAYRGWGYGSEAVRLLEEWAARERIAKRFRATIDIRNGLGLYFWLRLGYRPAAAGEFHWPSDNARDMMPMVRIAD
jgi:GNAT superfamily N-acetyltransferase